MTAHQPLPRVIDPGLAQAREVPPKGAALPLTAPPRRRTPLVEFKRPVGAPVKLALGCCAWLLFLGG